MSPFFIIHNKSGHSFGHNINIRHNNNLPVPTQIGRIPLIMHNGFGKHERWKSPWNYKCDLKISKNSHFFLFLQVDYIGVRYFEKFGRECRWTEIWQTIYWLLSCIFLNYGKETLSGKDRSTYKTLLQHFPYWASLKS
jgi:hypothetical protein